MQWFEDPAFWDECRGVMFDAQRRERAADEVDAALGLLGVADSGRVLDLCCGPGRHALEFARRGYAVTGVDLHQPYLDEARRANGDVEWVRADMREFRREGAFDAAVNLYSSFGYFEDPEDDLRVARNVRASLAPGGRFLMDLVGREVRAAKFEERRWHELDDGTILLEHGRIQPGWRSCHTTWTIVSKSGRREHTFRVRLYAGTELAALLERAGFADVSLLGALDGRPYDSNAKRLVVLASA